MRRHALVGLLTLAVALVAAELPVTSRPAIAGTPSVLTVIEGRTADDADAPVLVVLGRSLNRITSYELGRPGPETDPLASGAPVFRSRSELVVPLPASVAADADTTYVLTLNYRQRGRLVPLTTTLTLTGGRPRPGAVTESALAADLLQRLADAGNLDAGTLSPLRFSAYDDLTAESRIGTGASQVAVGDHLHDGRYATMLHNHDVSYANLMHTHSATYVQKSGDTMTGSLTVNTGTLYAHDSNNGYGGYFDTPAGGGYGVYGAQSSGAGAGVYGYSSSGSGAGVHAVSNGNALVANFFGSGSSSSSGNNVAVFQSAGANVARIDKSGTGYFNGGTQTSGADIAESMPADAVGRSLEPGDVLMISERRDGAVTLCTESESTRVAGVYSTRPGVLLTMHDAAGGALPEDEVPCGIQGRVPVRCCDEGGAIRRGDLLVTSSRAGFARRAPPSPKPGTVLGKALAELPEGEGRILVLVTLQ